MKITPQMRWAFAEFNVAVLMSRQAYDQDPNSTYRQHDDYTRRNTDERQATDR